MEEGIYLAAIGRHPAIESEYSWSGNSKLR